MAIRTPIIAIVGRPNVGKSTLFNRVLGTRRAVVENVPGVTRDRNYALVERYSVPFYLVDTGGFEEGSEESMQQHVSNQATLAAEEADLIISLYDAKAGLQQGDKDVLKLLRRFEKPILHVANKVDGVEQAILAAEFYSLGVDEVLDVSALHGRAVKDLVERALSSLPEIERLRASVAAKKAAEEQAAAAGRQRMAEVEEELREIVQEFEAQDALDSAPHLADKTPVAEEPKFAPVFVPGEDSGSLQEYEKSYRLSAITSGNAVRRLEEDELEQEVPEEKVYPETIRVALIGRPNAGKSTMLNTLTGESRAITSSEAGTTRDSLHQEITRDAQRYLIIDTAGLRKKARVGDTIEKYSTIRALNAISECDVAVVMIDAVRGPSEQDAKILGLAHEQGKGIVIAVNKWDAVSKTHKSVQEYKKDIADTFKFVPYAPIIFVSALTGKRCPKVIETVKEVAYQRLRRVPTRRLNKILRAAADRGTAPRYRGQAVRLYYAAQVDTQPPRILLVFNYPRHVHFSFLRYLKNVIREEFGFEGTDVKFVLRKK